jgi:hypothetical protein
MKNTVYKLTQSAKVANQNRLYFEGVIFRMNKKRQTVFAVCPIKKIL